MAHLLGSVRSHPPAAGIVGMAPTPGLHVVAAFHRGPLGPLQRLIQPDLGLLFMEREVVRTTYVAFLNLGLTREILSGSSLSLDNLGPTCGTRWTTSPRRRLAPREAGRRRGSHRVCVGGATEAHAIPRPQVRGLLYGSIARRVAPGRNQVGILMTQMLSQVNTARIFVPRLAGRHEVAAFKIRFVSLFQTALGLRKLLEEERDSHFLQPDAIEVVGETLASAQVGGVLENHGLRNTLVHYGVGKRAAPLLPTAPLRPRRGASTRIR